MIEKAFGVPWISAQIGVSGVIKALDHAVIGDSAPNADDWVPLF